MTYSNVQLKNSGNDEGDVLNFFNTTLRNLVQKNSGDNTYSMVAEDCHDKDFPVNMNTKTKLRLTHSSHTISQIEKGFIQVELELKLKFETPFTNELVNDSDGEGDKGKEDLNHLLYIFVGFKDAVELISEVYFWVDGKLVDSYHQQEMIRESFAYNCIRPRDAKTGIPHSHSLWESVQSMSPNVAGIYIPFEKFSNKGEPVVKIDLIIPFTDQLALQAWRLYPNRVLGEMEEEVKFALNGLVWCQVNPKNVAEVKRFWDFDPTVEYNFPDVPITNHFTQINQSAVITKSARREVGTAEASKKGAYWCQSSKFVPEGTLQSQGEKQPPKWAPQPAPTPLVTAELMTNKLQLDDSSCKVSRCRTNCAGFGLKKNVNNQIFEILNEPININLKIHQIPVDLAVYQNLFH